MENERTAADISAALAGVRRRARYLEEAGRWSWSWSALIQLAVPLALAIYMIASSDGEIPRATLGLVLLVSAGAAWQIRRLHSRVEEITAHVKILL